MVTLAKKVLFYDDAKKEVEKVAEALKRAGVQVDVVERFSRARELVLSRNYDVVVFDLRLDNELDLDGLQFLTTVWDVKGQTKYVIYSRWVDMYQDAVEDAITEGRVARCFWKSDPNGLLQYLRRLLE